MLLLCHCFRFCQQTERGGSGGHTHTHMGVSLSLSVYIKYQEFIPISLVSAPRHGVSFHVLPSIAVIPSAV